MAIDLAYSSSPFEFENMLPLDVLAAVASETLRNEIISNDVSEIKTSNNLKKQMKKSVTNILTFEEIKSMPVKSLIEKFAEMISDELTKKYFYKCLLLPENCSMIFESFGNEKKACDKMKSHLLSHVQQLSKEYESNSELPNLFFIPKSPFSKHSEKLSKKSLKKQQFSFNHVLPRAESLKSSKKSKNSTFCLSKMKKNLHDMNKKRVSEKVKNVMKYLTKSKTKMFNSVYMKDKSSLKYLNNNNNNFISDYEEDFINEIQEAQEEYEAYERYNTYSEHLQYVFLSDTVVKDETSESPSSSEQVSDSMNDDNYLEETNISSNSTSCSSDKSFNFPHDHNYINFEGSGKILSQDYKSSPRKYVSSFPRKPVVMPQFIIRTPPFPFVYTPLLPEIAGIEEVGYEGNATQQNDYSNCVHCMLGEKKVKREVQDRQSDELASDQEGKFSSSVFYKMNGASGSVLECVENIVNTKHSNSCVPKNEIASDNDENLENLQKVEKELALKYIAKLHGKGKKKIPDSLMCQICPDKHFTAQATLIHHYRSHAGIKPYICKICSSKFTRQHSLNYHMLIHQNRSRFTCEVCGRTFRHPSHYKEHLRRHTGETPYHCTDCNLHFKTRNTFKRHLKTRHGKLLTANGIEDLNVE